MGFAQLKKDVINKAEREAERIVKEAHKESEDEKRKLELELESKEEKAMENAKETIEIIERRELPGATLEAKKKKLVEKRKLIESIFEEARANIDKKLKKTERKDLINRILKKIESEITVGTLYCNKIDAELINNKKVKYKDMQGGIIAEDKTGRVLVDYSFETLLEQIREKYISEVTKILFE